MKLLEGLSQNEGLRGKRNKDANIYIYIYIKTYFSESNVWSVCLWLFSVQCLNWFIPKRRHVSSCILYH